MATPASPILAQAQERTNRLLERNTPSPRTLACHRELLEDFRRPIVQQRARTAARDGESRIEALLADDAKFARALEKLAERQRVCFAERYEEYQAEWGRPWWARRGDGDVSGPSADTLPSSPPGSPTLTPPEETSSASPSPRSPLAELPGAALAVSPTCFYPASPVPMPPEDYHSVTSDNVLEFFELSPWAQIEARLKKEEEKGAVWALLCSGSAPAPGPLPPRKPLHDFLRRLAELTLEGRDAKDVKATILAEERPAIGGLVDEERWADLAGRLAEDTVYLYRVPAACSALVSSMRVKVTAAGSTFFKVHQIDAETKRLKHYQLLDGVLELVKGKGPRSRGGYGQE